MDRVLGYLSSSLEPVYGFRSLLKFKQKFQPELHPLIMAYPEMLGDVEGDPEATALHREIREYFTFRPGQPVYNRGPERADHWGWLEIYPQHGFAPTPSGRFEQATVGVAQNWTAAHGLSAMNTPGAFGRSYTLCWSRY